MVEGAYVQLEDAYCLKSVEEAMRIAEPIEVCVAQLYTPALVIFVSTAVLLFIFMLACSSQVLGAHPGVRVCGPKLMHSKHRTATVVKGKSHCCTGAVWCRGVFSIKTWVLRYFHTSKYVYPAIIANVDACASCFLFSNFTSRRLTVVMNRLLFDTETR